MNTSIAASAFAPFSTGLVTARFYETWDFYTMHLGFGTLQESDERVQLVHSSGAILTVLREETDGHPPELIPATSGQGFWLTLEVADPDEEHARLRGAGVEIASELTNTRCGERRFAVRDPNGVVIFIARREGTATRSVHSLNSRSSAGE